MREDEEAGVSMPPSAADDDAARERRLEALHRLAQAVQPATSAAAAGGPAPVITPATRRAARFPRHTLWLGTALVVLCVAVVAGLIVRGLPQSQGRKTSTATPPQQIVTIRLKTDRLTCFADVAWSHDGTRVAAVGSESFGRCPGTGLVNIYTTATGKLTAQIREDGDILHAMYSSYPTSPQSAEIGYHHVLWSHDDRQLAVPFAITFPNAPSADTAPGFAGVMLLDIGGGAPARVLLHPTRGYAPYAARWGLSAGSATLASPQVTGSEYQIFASLPPAYSYSWDASGALVPAIPFTAQLPQPCGYPVGNPAGDGAISIWQLGEAALWVSSADGKGTPVFPGAYTWQTAFAAWSPDGRYLLDDTQLLFRTEPIGKTPPSAAGLSALALERAPVAPIRDRALQAVYAGMVADAFDPARQHVALAWRPDGRYLAALPETFFAGQSAGPTSHAVTVYDCASGTPVRTLTPPPAPAQPGFSAQGVLYWSPDGSRLLLFDPTTSVLTIWGQSLLP
jgi:hypothetical protein